MGTPQTYEEKTSCCKSSLSIEKSPAPDVYVDMDTVSIRHSWQNFKVSNASSDVVLYLLTSAKKFSQTSNEDDLIKSRWSLSRCDPAEDTVLILTTTSRSKTISNIHPMVRTASTAVLGMATEGNNLPGCRAKRSSLSKMLSRPYIRLFRPIILLLKIFHFQLQKENQQSDERLQQYLIRVNY